ncbi:hypothetical protein ANCDUO_01756 [Ancylostoma duodenale]|uniref:Uncharacterized protein n=1 Tax=Ancylostoma duodenale TaxID=51022 RepID=A0A0C2HEE6_9BILA|nr:hypothetical protein ANCDUO_01756 [Ancylostoma duodenale]
MDLVERTREDKFVLPDYFNATITYRRDSHYFHPYGHFPPLQAGLPADAIFTEEQNMECSGGLCITICIERLKRKMNLS